MAQARWAARFEKISLDPLFIFDGGHNPQGVDSCIEGIKHYFGNKRLLVVTGVMADKDYPYIARRIGEIAEAVYCITPKNPRALDSWEYAKEFSSLGIEAQGTKNAQEAVFSAMERAKKEKRSIVALGSLYMYSEIFDAVKNCQNL
jgi:dihydrofolate synthase/folylpolyglutamate synthase